jgi:hypothetical protein
MYFLERPLELSEKIAQNLNSSRRNMTGEQFDKCFFLSKEIPHGKRWLHIT